MIYHWCPAEDWHASTGEYAPPTFPTDGFVHCSFLHQVEQTATRHDRGRTDLVLLCIDDTDLEVVTEDLYRVGEEYPHVYQPIHRRAVVDVIPFPPEPDGSFRLPHSLTT